MGKKPFAHQRGAAMVLALVLLSASVIAWQCRASLSQIVMAQQSLDQATSAAALGAAQWHARVLNAHALLNRTEMAHQVAMAHLMAVASAWEMRTRMGEQVSRHHPPASLIGMFFGRNHARAYRSAQLGRDPTALQDLKRAFDQHDKLLSGNLRRARADLMRDLPKRTQTLVREILRRNLGRALWAEPQVLVQVSHPGGLPSSVHRMGDERWQAWLDAVIRRHGYLQRRSHLRVAFSPLYPECPWMKHLLVRNGETIVSIDGNWRSDETLSFHSVRRIISKFCYFREYPMGWSDIKVRPASKRTVDSVGGGVQVPENFKGTTFRKWVNSLAAHAWSLFDPFHNHLAARKAEMRSTRWMRTSHPVPYQLGLNISNPVMVVRSSIPTSTLHQSAWRVRLRLAGLLDAKRPMWPRKLKAIASAQVAYERFPSINGRMSEQPNLLQPFWDAHQVPVSVSKLKAY